MPVPHQPSEWLDALGVALREKRLAAGLSQAALALEVAKPADGPRPARQPSNGNYLGEVERAQRNPTVKYVVEVVNELDGDVAGVFARAEELLATADTRSKRGPLHYRDAG